MHLFEKIEDILENKDFIISRPIKKEDIKLSSDGDIFNRLSNFIINLDPDDLNENQIQEVLSIIEKIDGLEESGNPRLSRMSSVGSNSNAKKWYRENKGRVKQKKKEFMNSKEGRKKEKEKREKQGKETRKTKYHRRIRSDRDDYEKREHGK